MASVRSSSVFVMMLLGAVFYGCVSTPTLSIDGPSPTRVTRLELGDWQGQGKALGDAPLTVPLAEVEGRLLRLQTTGKDPLYWLVTKGGVSRVEAKIKFPDTVSGSVSSTAKDGICRTDGRASANRVMRLMLKAYKFVADQDFKKAKEAADEATVIDSELAAPYVVKGIALLGEGDKSGARQALTKAQTLDPDDKDIDSLLKSLP